MCMDKLWEMANTISAIAGLLISAILVMRSPATVEYE